MSIPELLRDIAAQGLSITVDGGNLRLGGPTQAMDAALVERIRAAKPDLLRRLTAPAGTPVTPLQAAYLFGRLDSARSASHVYHEISGRWDVPALTEGLRRVVARHPALRARFTPDGRQVIHDDVPVHIRVRDLRALPERALAESLAAHRAWASHLALPLDRPPLVRAEVSVLTDDQMVLHVGHDGLVMDGISMFLFFRDWWRAYGGADLTESEPMTVDAYTTELERSRGRAPAERSRRYWLDHLADLAPAPDLPLASPDAPDTTALAARPGGSAPGQPRFTPREVRLDAAGWGALRQRAAGAGITPAALLLTAYAQVLGVWGAGEEFTLVTTVANRPPVHPGVFDAVGQFSDTMLVEVRSGTGPFAARASAVQERLRSGMENRHFSGVEVLREVARRGGAMRLPYTFNCAIGYVRSDVDGSALDLFGPQVFTVSQTPQVWLNVFAMERRGELVIQLDGVDGMFPDGLLDALCAGYQRLLEQLRDGPGWEGTVDLLPDDQRGRRTRTNETAAAQDERPLATRFVEHATTRPDAPAIVAGPLTVTYGELHRRASRVAAWLRAQGAGRDELVALVMARGPEQVVGILATTLAGCAYLPVDAGLPPQRRAYMLRDGQVRLVLTNVALDGPGPDDHGDVQILDVTEVAGDGPVAVERLPGAGPDDLAYVLYTSGTTGDPKGVMVSQRSVVNVVTDCLARFGIDATDRFFGISAFNFDLSVFDVFGALSAGAAIVLPDHARANDPAHWLDLCESAAVTVWNSVPAIVGLLREQAAEAPQRLGALRLVMMSGDRIPPDLPGHLLSLWPHLEVVSLGGPTETTVWNILHPVSPADDGADRIPYGRPNANNRVYVLDAEGQDAPDWVAGEIVAAGVGVARGYWGDQARTDDRFRIDAGRGERLYRTGDLGRFRPDGVVEILGRTDFQIKLNGYRIEAGEVEARLVDMAAVKQAAVVRQSGANGDRLVAHLAPAGDARPGETDIRNHLRISLPEYMIPTTVVWHDALPLTRNGKVDRASLVTMPAPVGAASPVPNAAGESVAGLAEVWARVLRVGVVEPDASFFDLGGDSLGAARILTEVRKRYGVTIPLDQMYEVRTVRTMAARIEELTGGAVTERSREVHQHVMRVPTKEAGA